jgi:class 3 adenylate cyclase
MSQTRRLAAILAADVAGYSRLMGGRGRTLQALKAIRAELIDPTIAAHNGRLVKTTGNGFGIGRKRLAHTGGGRASTYRVPVASVGGPRPYARKGHARLAGTSELAGRFRARGGHRPGSGIL